MKMLSELKRIADVTASETNTMLDLMRSIYDNVNEQKFLEDLNEKDGVLLIRDERAQIQGFSTYQLARTLFRRRRIYALFSGDTAIHNEYWGQMQLFRSFGRLIEAHHREYTPLYWHLLTKGVRTYLLLPLFFRRFHPSNRKTATQFEKELLAHLTEQRFGEFFLEDKGVVRVRPPADRLRDEFAEIPTRLKARPHVKFFLLANPGYADGDELACLTEITRDNLTKAGRRFAGI